MRNPAYIGIMIHKKPLCWVNARINSVYERNNLLNRNNRRDVNDMLL